MLIICCFIILALVLFVLIWDPILKFLKWLFHSKSTITLEQLSQKQRKILVSQILDWCISDIHLNKNRRIKPVIVISNRRKTNIWGSYCSINKKITIYILKHTSIEEVCDTIIHEYVHHLQIRNLNDDMRYNKLTNLNSYWENDFEVEARFIASKYSRKCMDDLKF
jgi:hypothetical protein